MTTPVLVLAAIAMLITYQGVPVPRVAAADLAVQLSPTGPVQADGYYFAASAVGSVVGCLLAGLLAQSESFNAVNWLAAIAGIAATASLWPLLRSRPNRRTTAHQLTKHPNDQPVRQPTRNGRPLDPARPVPIRVPIVMALVP